MHASLKGSFKGSRHPLRVLGEEVGWEGGMGELGRKNAENPRKSFEKAGSHQEVQNIKEFITKTAQI